ncbi:MAG: AMP-dependent synthetase/ligase [Saprospiraceae bacterium]
MTNARLFDFLHNQLRDYPQPRAFGHKVGGEWRYFSTAEMVDMTNRASVGLLRLGLRPGDRVATVVYRCSPEWVALDYAMLQIGVLNIPMYPTISPREYEYILNESEAQLCFVGDGDLLEKVRAAQPNVPKLREILTFHDHPTARKWDIVLADTTDFDEVWRIKSGIQPDDLATIIYTSGTTGNPKGVMLTHRNIVFNVEAMRPYIPILPGERGLSFLPVSHIFERAVIYAYTAYGASTTFVGTDNLGGETGDLRTVKPHFFTTVPRLLEKVYDKIYAKGLELTGLKRALFFWAMRLTDNWEFDQKTGLWRAIQLKIADRLIFSKWRDALGGHLKGIITGASACPMRVMRVFNAAGIRVREAYGLTEAAPAISFNRFEPGGAMLGTVGPAVGGVEIRIEPGGDYRPGEGEVLAKSPGVMLGYYLKPDATAEMLREIDGQTWLATGDVGTLMPGPGGLQFLKITDRKKELLKTSLGKYVAPAPIEASLREDELVEQAMVVGENLKFVSALIVPAEDALRGWCARHQIEWTNLADVLRRPEVLARYQRLVDKLNPQFSHSEQIKKFALLPVAWEPVKLDGSDAELTPTMKLKRRVIMEKYRRDIEAMYEA